MVALNFKNIKRVMLPDSKEYEDFIERSRPKIKEEKESSEKKISLLEE